MPKHQKKLTGFLLLANLLLFPFWFVLNVLPHRVTASSYDHRYSPWWDTFTSPLTRWSLMKRCTLSIWHHADVAHHAYYGFLGLPIPGLEIPGVQVFPLCKHCHEHRAHHRAHWLQVRVNADWRNHQKSHFYWRLVIAFWTRFFIQWGVAVAAIVYLAYVFTQ